jgi:hypothetical protein
MATNNLEARKKAIQGFISSPLIIKNLMQDVLANEDISHRTKDFRFNSMMLIMHPLVKFYIPTLPLQRLITLHIINLD